MRKSKLGIFLLGAALAVGAGAGVALVAKEAISVDADSTVNFTLSSADAVEIDGVSASFDKGNGSNAPTWYAAGLRLYANNTFTISSASTITEISINWEKQGNKAFATATASVGDYTHPTATGTGTWSGSANEVVFTLGASGQLQLNTFSVTIGGSAKVLDHITLTGDLDKTVYTEGEHPSSEGLVVTAYYDDDSTSTVSTATITADPETLNTVGDSISVKFTATYNEKQAELVKTVKVNEFATTPLSSFYDGTITLKTSSGSLTSSDWYYVKGVVVGVNGYQYYIQQGEYGLLIFGNASKHPGYYEGVKVGDLVRLYARVYKYNNLVETYNSDTDQTVTKLGTSALPEAAVYNSYADFLNAHQSTRASLMGASVDATNITTISSFDGASTSDQSFKIGSGTNEITVFISKNVAADAKTPLVAKLKQIEATDTVDFVRIVVAFYNKNQVSLSSEDQVIIHKPTEDKLASWGVNYLFIGNSSFDGDGTGLCKSSEYYKDAKTQLFVLENEQAGTITTLQEDSTYSAELARYTAWAKACEDDKPFENNFDFVNASHGLVQNSTDTNMSIALIIIVTSVAVISTAAIVTLIVVRKKRFN